MFQAMIKSRDPGGVTECSTSNILAIPRTPLVAGIGWILVEEKFSGRGRHVDDELACFKTSQSWGHENRMHEACAVVVYAIMLLSICQTLIPVHS